MVDIAVKEKEIEKVDDGVESMIYEVNGTQVMLESELAKLYQCKNGTKEINQAVKNNPLKFHDRFIIIDSKKLYSCGASFKDLGKKCFAINEMKSEELINNLLNIIFD